ncbi:Methylmalonyl-CoA mutase [Bradyrhizobium sp. Gha]|nr:Methylmalonyl-CoA mutase [Bradyrhizobium sp. Gha]
MRSGVRRKFGLAAAYGCFRASSEAEKSTSLCSRFSCSRYTVAPQEGTVVRPISRYDLARNLVGQDVPAVAIDFQSGLERRNCALGAAGPLADSTGDSDRLVGALVGEVESVCIDEILRVGDFASERDRVPRARRAEAAAACRKFGRNAEKSDAVRRLGELPNDLAGCLERQMSVPEWARRPVPCKLQLCRAMSRGDFGAADRFLGAYRPQHPTVPAAGERDHPHHRSLGRLLLCRAADTRSRSQSLEPHPGGRRARRQGEGNRGRLAQTAIEEASAKTQARIDAGKQAVIGVNKYKPTDEDRIEILKVDNTKCPPASDRQAEVAESGAQPEGRRRCARRHHAVGRRRQRQSARARHRRGPGQGNRG